MGKKKRAKEAKKNQNRVSQSNHQFPHLGAPIWKFLGLYGIIAISVLIVYSNTYEAPFILDDKENLEMIPSETLGDLFKTLTGQALFYDQLYSGFPWFLKRPIGYFTFAVNKYFSDMNVTAYHITNIFIHLVNAFLFLYFLLKTLQLYVYLKMGTPPSWKELLKWGNNKTYYALEIGFFATLLWSIHPLQIQSVTYTIQRFSSLSFFFFVLGMIFYIHGRISLERKKQIALFLLSLLFGFFAISTKQNKVVFPIIILLYEFCFFRPHLFYSPKRQLYASLVFLLIVIGIALFIGLNQWIAPHVYQSTYERLERTMLQQLYTEWRVLIYYLSMILLPLPSRITLMYNYSTSNTLFDPITTFLSLLFILASLAYALFSRNPLITFGIFWYSLNLIVESSIFPLEFVFLHRLYTPMLGILVILLYAIFSFITNYVHLNHIRIACGWIVIFFMIFTFQRNLVWQEPEMLWKDNLEKAPYSLIPNINIANIYANNKDYSKAMEHLNRAIKHYPRNHLAYYSKGLIYTSQKEYKKAVLNYKTAIRIAPNFSKPYNNLGNTYIELNQLDKAIEMFEEGISRTADKNTLMNMHYNLGNVYLKQKKNELAIDHFTKSLDINPLFMNAYIDRGRGYANLEEYKKAIDQYNKVLKVVPRFDLAYLHKGAALEKLGEYFEAIECYRKFIEYQDNQPRKYIELAKQRIQMVQRYIEQSS